MLLEHGRAAEGSSRHGGIALGALAIQAAAAIVGWWLGWYEQIGWYDELVHVGFGFAVSLAAGIRLHGLVLTGANSHGAALALVLVAIGLGVGAAWELLEFTFDQLALATLSLGRSIPWSISSATQVVQQPVPYAPSVSRGRDGQPSGE